MSGLCSPCRLFILLVFMLCAVAGPVQGKNASDHFPHCSCGRYNGYPLQKTKSHIPNRGKRLYLDSTQTLGDGLLTALIFVAADLESDLPPQALRVQIWDLDVNNTDHVTATLVFEKRSELECGDNRVYKLCLAPEERIWLKPTYRLGLANEGDYSSIGIIAFRPTGRPEFPAYTHHKDILDDTYPEVGATIVFPPHVFPTRFTFGVISTDKNMDCAESCCPSTTSGLSASVSTVPTCGGVSRVTGAMYVAVMGTAVMTLGLCSY